jgi:hypothetical protein
MPGRTRREKERRRKTSNSMTTPVNDVRLNVEISLCCG